MFHTRTNDSKQHVDSTKANSPLQQQNAYPTFDESHAPGLPPAVGRSLAPPAPVSPRMQKLMRLQKAYGNQVVLRMIEHSKPAMQPKLVVNEPGDAYEQEADRVAEQVMRMPDPKPSVASAPEQLFRKCAACEEEDKKKLQMKPAGTPEAGGREAPPIVHEVLRSPGEPLDPATRAFFEPRFGYDFSNVRVHADEKAAESARAVGALAYTVGAHIAFAERKFAPTSEGGRRLIAHELTHVLHQSQGASVPLQRWTYEDSCGSFLNDLGTADDTAKDMVQAAIDSLSISPPDRRTKNSLFAYFRIRESSPNMPDLIAAVLGVYEQISSHFKASDYDYECSCHDCPDPSIDLGCSSIGEGPVTVCIANQHYGAVTMAATIVHEFSHRFAGTEDFSYCESGPGCHELTPDKAIGNAESYALFAAEAWFHKMGA